MLQAYRNENCQNRMHVQTYSRRVFCKSRHSCALSYLFSGRIRDGNQVLNSNRTWYNLISQWHVCWTCQPALFLILFNPIIQESLTLVVDSVLHLIIFRLNNTGQRSTTHTRTLSSTSYNIHHTLDKFSLVHHDWGVTFFMQYVGRLRELLPDICGCAFFPFPPCKIEIIWSVRWFHRWRLAKMKLPGYVPKKTWKICKT